MGFTPLDGIVMATRAGSVDPGLLLWLLTHGALDASEVAEGLERHAGLAGLAQSGDMRDVLAGRADDDPEPALRFDVYVHRLCRERMKVVLGTGLSQRVDLGGSLHIKKNIT